MSSPTASSPNRPRYDWFSVYKLPPPAFFFKSKEDNIYFMDNTQRHLVDPETFRHLGYPANDLPAGIADGTQLGYPEGTPLTRLLKGSGEQVYWMENGFRRHIPDMDTFRKLGYRPEDIFQISDELLGTWPLGEPLPSVLGTAPESIPAQSQERVVLSYRPRDRHSRASELYTVYADGTNPRRLSYTTGYTYHSDPSWSPDGRSIAFAQCLADYTKPGCMIAITSNARWNPQQLIEASLLHSPAWSPDGIRLAFVQIDFAQVYSLTVMDAAGGNVLPLAAHGWPFAWTPEGRLAFWSREAKTPEKFKLMVMDADGQNIQPVETQITILDQRYSPWRQAAWIASGSPDYPAGR
jgi:hypothetical protein